jgi:Xaa-Pro aminopeptidase
MEAGAAWVGSSIEGPSECTPPPERRALENFPVTLARVFAERRQRVLDAMGEGAIAIFLGASLVTRSRDTEFPFRQDSDFHYLTGFDHPDAVAVLRTDGGPRFTLYVQPRNRDQEVWTGHRPGVEGAVADYGADEAHPRDDFEKHLPNLISRAERVFHVLGRDRKLDELLTETAENLRLRSRQGVTPPDRIIDPRGIVHELRLFKSDAELAIMRRASEISRRAHAEAARIARNGAHEYELQAAIEWSFRRLGSSGPAYGSIVGGGANATVLHYISNHAPLRDGELVLIDAGCELEGYASDVTRTYPVGGRMQGAARDVYAAVLAAQERALAACRAGKTLAHLHELTTRALVEGLISLGLLEGSADQAIANESFRRFYMHNTSHWLGLDVHDVGNYRLRGEPRKLEPGMVFTIEPGLYIARDDEKAPAAFRGIGVRIEDDVAITERGVENLTAAIPKQIPDLEALFAGAN